MITKPCRAKRLERCRYDRIGFDRSDARGITLMHQVDDWLSHVWMVRTFLKHSDEASDDEELAEVHRSLYDFMLALVHPTKPTMRIGT